jgi:uncharacterized protein YjhX (UPF0386 family)
MSNSANSINIRMIFPLILLCRYECQFEECVKKSKVYCYDHEEFLCHDCAVDVHYECKFKKLVKQNYLQKTIDSVQKRLDEMLEFPFSKYLQKKIPDFDSQLRDYEEEFTNIKDEIKLAMAQNALYRYGELKKQALK